MAISYNTTTKEITVTSATTVRAVYSDSMAVFAGSTYMQYLVPLRADTPTLFTLINGWVFTSGSIQYINSAALQDAAGDNIWDNVQTLGSIVSGTTLYINQSGSPSDNTKVTTAATTGHINILLKVRSAGSDVNGKNFTTYARKFGQTYSQFSTTGGAIVSNIPLATAADPNLDTTTYSQSTLSGWTDLSITWGAIKRSAFDGLSTQKYTLNGDHTDSVTTFTVNETIDASVPSSGYFQVESEVVAYTGKNTHTFTGCTRGQYSTTAAAHISGKSLNTNMADYGVLVKTTNASRTVKEVYNWVQYMLLQTTDIDASASTHYGYITDPLLAMAGSTVFTQNVSGAGVWVEGFTAADTNNIQYTDNSSTTHSPPLSVTVIVSCDSGMNGGQASVFTLDTAGLSDATYTPANITGTLINSAISGGAASTSITYTSDIPVRVVTRKAGYQPFTLYTTVKNTGLSVTSINAVDTIYQ